MTNTFENPRPAARGTDMQYARQGMPVFRQRENAASIFENVSFGWITANLRPPSIGLFLFLIGFHAMYFLPLVFPGSVLEVRSPTARAAYAAASLLLVVGGVCEMARRNMSGVKNPIIWTSLTAIVVFYMVIRGVAESANWYLMLRQAGPFLMLLAIPPIGSHRDNWPWLWLTFIVHAIIGLPIYYYLVVSGGLTSRGAIMLSDKARLAGTGIYMARFLFLMLPVIRSHWLKLLALFVFATGLLSALFVAQRGPWFHAAVATCIIIFVVIRKHGILGYLSHFLPRTLIYIPLLAVFILGFAAIVMDVRGTGVYDAVTTAYRGLEARFTSKGSVTDTILQNERWIEFEAVVSTMSATDWIFGKGLCATWSDPRVFQGRDRSMVHNTWLNCFYWGGVGMFLCVFWPLLWSLRVILFSKSVTGMCCAGFILLTYWTFPFFLIADITTRWILFCIAVGACRWHIELKA